MRFSHIFAGCLAASLVGLATVDVAAGQQLSWAGANSFLLHAMPTAARTQVLNELQKAGFKVIRIFINELFANEKNSGNVAVKDLESVAVGTYDDRVLNMIDTLMFEVAQRGMKLNIALHDRYSLGCFKTDAYVKKYNLPVASKCPTGNNVSAFYKSAAAAADIDRRNWHIVSHKNPLFGFRPWGQIPEAIFGFDIENEAQAHNSPVANPDWICSRATILRPAVKKPIQIITGGGAKFDDSILPQHLDCPAIDVVAVHSYDGDFKDRLPAALATVTNKGKRLLVQEFGVAQNKVNGLTFQIGAMNAAKVPWMIWQVVKPNNPTDFETFIEDSATWNLLAEKAKEGRRLIAATAWPEV